MNSPPNKKRVAMATALYFIAPWMCMILGIVAFRYMPSDYGFPAGLAIWCLSIPTRRIGARLMEKTIPDDACRLPSK